MSRKILKHLLDIESVIEEIEAVLKRIENSFKAFEEDFIVQRAVERELEIIGEAVNKISKLDPSVEISDLPNIVALRNLIIHAYDSIDPELLWATIQNDIPVLKLEIKKLIGREGFTP